MNNVLNEIYSDLHKLMHISSEICINRFGFNHFHQCNAKLIWCPYAKNIYFINNEMPSCGKDRENDERCEEWLTHIRLIKLLKEAK